MSASLASRTTTTTDAYTDAELRLGRKLTVAERQIDIVALDRDLAKGKEQLYAAVEKEKRRAVRAHFNGGRARLKVTPEMVAVLQGLHDAGRKHARREIQALTGKKLTSREFAEDDIAKLTAKLDKHLKALGKKVEAKATALGGGTLDDAARFAMTQQVAQMPGALNVASQMVSSALYSGVGSVYSEEAGLFGSWQYSAVMDNATCDPCAELDGEEYESWEAIQEVLPDGGPNPECDGEGRCRCRAVPGDVQPEAGGGAAPAPDDLGAPAVLEDEAIEQALPDLVRAIVSDERHAIAVNHARKIVKHTLGLRKNAPSYSARTGLSKTEVQQIEKAVQDYMRTRKGEAGAAELNVAKRRVEKAAPPPPDKPLMMQQAKDALRKQPEGTRVRVGESREWFGSYTYDFLGGTMEKYRGITVLIEDGVPERALSDLRNTVDNVLKQTSKSNADKLAEVNVFARGSPADPHWAVAYNTPGFTSGASAGGGRMEFWNGRNLNNLDLFRHEYGHIIGVRNGPPDLSLWEKARHLDTATSSKFKRMQMSGRTHQAGTKNVTTYGANALVEDWAESVMLFLRDRANGSIGTITDPATKFLRPVRFAEVWPERAKLLRKALGEPRAAP